MQYKQICNSIMSKINYLIDLNKNGIVENKYININNKNFPTEGVAVLTAGCPASGKSSIIKHQLLLEGKVIDIDNFSESFLKKYIQMYNNELSEIEKQKISDKFHGEFNLENENAEMVHNEVKPMFNKFKKNFIQKSKDSLIKPNIIIDGTLKDESKTKNIIDDLKKYDYYVVICLAICSKQTAIDRNNERKRKVKENLVKQIHNAIYYNLPNLNKKGELKNVDEFWIIFTEDYQYELKQSLSFNKDKTMININPNWANGTAFKLEKRNDKFIIPNDLKERYELIIKNNFDNPKQIIDKSE